MERLTEKRNDKNVVPLRNAICGVNMPHWEISKANDLEKFLSGDAADRLAAYEDTDLSPEICREYKIFEDEIVSKGVTIKRIVELMNAESEGRLVALETTPRDSYEGLKRKYFVFKSDTGELVENCFILRPDRDETAKEALRAYARSTDNKQLAHDIFCWVGPLEEAEQALKTNE